MKHFVSVLSLLTLLAAPVASLAAKPIFVPPGKLRALDIRQEAKNNKPTVAIHATSTKRDGNEGKNATSTKENDNNEKNEGVKVTSTPRQHLNFVLTGEVVSVNASSSMLDVKIKTINHLNERKTMRGQTLTIKVTILTDIKRPGLRHASLADIAIGNRVTVRGSVANDLFTATSIVAAGKPSAKR